MVAEKIQRLYSFFVGFEVVNSAGAIVANLTLIYLIMYRSSPELGRYRHLLLAFAINDVYFPVVHLLTLPVSCTYNDAFVMFSDGIFTSSVSICLFCSAYAQTMPLLSHLFLYRLVALKWPHHLKYYSARAVFVCVSLTLGVVGTAWFCLCYFGYGAEQEERDYVLPFFDELFNGDRKEFIGALFYNDIRHLRMNAVLSTMAFNVIMTFCMTIIVYCTVSIISYFKMTIPAVFLYFPCAGIINLAMAGCRISIFPNLTPATASAYPLIDACIVMYGVRCYRQSLVNFFTCGYNSKVTEISKSQTTTTQA